MPKEFFNRLAARWDEVVSEKDTGKLEGMTGRLGILPGAAVLDIGTGTGVLIPYLLSRVGQKGRLVAVDFADEMLNIARGKGFKGNIEYICSDVSGMPLADGLFDSVVCYSSFPHFPDKPLALAEISRVLKRGGRLNICHTSCREHINNIHGKIPDVRHDLIPDEAEMRAMLKDASFIRIEIADEAESYLASGVKG